MMLAIGNPFISAYLQADWFGRLVFLSLFILSMLSWWILIHKIWIFYKVRRLSYAFSKQFSDKDPLGLQFQKPLRGSWMELPHPYFDIYKVLKQYTLQIISRNHQIEPELPTALSVADLDLIAAQVSSAVVLAAKKMEKNLFVLSTTVTLAPFLGLLGTVWGILLAFSQIQHKGGAAASHVSMLSGLSLALATTVIGLIVAIPALIGYNYLRNAGREYRRDMENFSHLLLTALELQYRKTVHEKTLSSNS